MIEIQGKYGEIIYVKTNTISTFSPLNGFKLEAEYTNQPTKSHILLNVTYKEKNIFGELEDRGAQPGSHPTNI